MNEQHCMWNAGVVGISKLHLESTISEALKICDQMCSNKITEIKNVKNYKREKIKRFIIEI